MNHYGIALFHNRGDVLSATPIAHQLRVSEPWCRITWFTSTMGACVLEHNPDVDEVVVLEGRPEHLDQAIPELRASRTWTRFFTPAAYMNYDVAPGGAIFDLVKASAKLEWTVPFQFRLRLSAGEVVAARRYWARLPRGPRILIETEFHSAQTPWNEDYLCDLVMALKDLDPLLILTAGNRPPFLDRLLAIHPRTVWCREPFRLNAEFFNLSDAFVGVSSGISALTYSDWCRTDVPRIEVSRGEHWSGAVLQLHERLQPCYSRRRFRQALRLLTAQLRGEPVPALHNLHAPASAQQDATEIPCPHCGSAQTRTVRGGGIVLCTACELIFTRAHGEATQHPLYRPPVGLSRLRPQVSPGLDPPACTSWLGSLLNDSLRAWGPVPERAAVLLLGEDCAGLHETLVGAGRPSVLVPRRLVSHLGSCMRPSSVDLIFAPHVLDQVKDPLDLLDRVSFLLRRGGVLLLTVPNLVSLGAMVFPLHWQWLQPDRRLCHFTPKSLRDLVREAGLDIIRVTTAVGQAGEPMALEALQRARPQVPPRGLSSLLPELHAIGAGEELQLTARKGGCVPTA